MKRIIFLAVTAYLSLCARAQNTDEKTPYLTKPFAGQSIKNVDSKTSGGSITVIGGHASDARVEMYVYPNNGRNSDLSKEEIQKRLTEDYDINISLNGTKLSATAKTKEHFSDWKHTLSISFKIYVPQDVSTDLGTSGGSIHLATLSGTQYFRTSGGSLHVDQVTGKMDGQTSGGSIHVTNSKDDIDLSTSGGSIEASGCTGKIRLNTSGGSLRLSNLQGTINATTSGGSVHGSDIGGELSAHTSGGNVDLTGLTCSLETSTSGGNIDVEIKQLGSYVKIRNSGGHIDLQVPANKGLDLKLYAEKISTGTLSNFSGSTGEHELEGKINGGGVPVTVDAGSGKINLTFK
jgi:DUF4097 and DUF4098 domain-containing protein YvlB